MIMNVIGWIIFGALVGWIASLIMDTNEEQGAVGNITVGILGAIIGGFIMNIFGAEISGFNLASLLVAILGAVILTFVLKMFGHGGNAHDH